MQRVQEEVDDPKPEIFGTVEKVNMKVEWTSHFLYSCRKEDWAAVTFLFKGICAMTAFRALLTSAALRRCIGGHI